MNKLLEKVRVYIESDELTSEQREVCYHTGNFVVRACPGSGKTRTVGTRFAWRMANWENRHTGIATISFTNVAYEEISDQLELLGFPVIPLWPHFLGTIDSFVNQFILLPFGHLTMGCNRRPEIVHDNNNEWVREKMRNRRLGECYQKGCDSTCFQYVADGNLEYCGTRRRPNCQSDKCHKVKDVMVKCGFALPSDAMYWAMKALELPAVRRAIASRFPEIIVDEAQDTSETQIRIIRILEDAGCTIALIGDPDQSIYGFNGARPDLFLEFEKRWESLPLSANFRSSHHICNATYLFSSLPKPAKAKGIDRDFPVKPLVFKYSIGKEQSLKDIFIALLDRYAVNQGKSNVLARRHTLVSQISGLTPFLWPRGVGVVSRSFAIAAAYRDNLMLFEAHHKVMWTLLRLCFGKGSYGPGNEAISEIGYRQWRRESWMLLHELPASDTRLGEWGTRIRPIVETFINRLGWPCQANLPMTLKRCNDPKGTNAVSKFIQVPVDSNNLKTTVVHQAKGKSFEAVMVVCGPGNRRRRSDLEQWLNPQNDEEDDERRVGYVAMTRPRKLLVLAAPETTSKNFFKRLSPYFEF